MSAITLSTGEYYGSPALLPGLPLHALAREGQINGASLLPPNPGYQNNTRPTFTPGAFTVLMSTVTDLGRMRIMLEAFIGADQACAAAFQQGQSQFSAAILQTTSAFVLFGANGGTHRWNFQGGILVPELSSFSLGITSPTASGPFTAGGLTWIDLTADLNFNARYTILFIGDSITYAQSAGPNGTANMNGNNGFPMIIRNHLLSRGVSVRHINKGVSGMNSQQALVRLNDNSFYHCAAECEKVALIVDCMGMNDAVIPTTQANFNAYLASVRALRDGYYPNADVLCVGPTSTDDPSRSTIGNYRTWKQQFASSGGGSTAGLFYADGSTAYGTDSTSISTYFAETATPHIHPNIAGHAAIANVLGPAIAQTRWGNKVLGGTW